MCQELLDLSDQQLAFMQAGALLCTATVMALGLRTLLQRYLDRALTGGLAGEAALVGGQQSPALAGNHYPANPVWAVAAAQAGTS